MSEREHGYARYKLDGCHCYACGFAAAAYRERVKRAIAYGTWQPFVDAETVREHIRALQSCSLGLRVIAAASGVDRRRLQVILNGHPELGTAALAKVRPETAAAILAVEPTLDLLPAKTVIDGSGSRRRLQALVTVGWSQAKLADRLDWTPGSFGTLIRSEQVTAGTARKVRVLYAELWDQAPPEGDHRNKIAASRARNYAAGHRWLPPQAWDDDLIDLPDDQLKIELARIVQSMPGEELTRCATAYAKHGDRSPLTSAAAREYRRRLRNRGERAA